MNNNSAFEVPPVLSQKEKVLRQGIAKQTHSDGAFCFAIKLAELSFGQLPLKSPNQIQMTLLSLPEASIAPEPPD